MSFKTFVILLCILLLGTFAYLKIELGGDPNSSFNQTTRFRLGAHPVLRFLFGINNPGDARAEYFNGSGVLAVEWFAPISENFDSSVVQQFADLAAKYTGRQVVVNFGGNIAEGTVPFSEVENLSIRGGAPPKGSSVLDVVFVTDYQPRSGSELSTTHGASTIVISLNANRGFVSNYSQNLDNYLLTDLLRGFGVQLGLPEQGTDTFCVMDPQVGINGQPMENFGYKEPQDYCPAEVDQLNQLKAKY